MKVLYVTNMYPYPKYFYYGIHVKEQIDSIRNIYGVDDTIFFINGRISKLNYFRSLVKANYLTYKIKADLIHVHFGISGIFLLFNPFLKVPVILTLHGSDLNTKNKIVKFLVKRIILKCSIVIVMNDKMREDVQPLPCKVQVIPCGIDLDLFKPAPRRPNKHLILGFAGNPKRPEKNYELFLKVIRLLNKEGHSVETVNFHNLSRPEVVDKLNSVEILLLTSYSEGSPQIIKEALACNTAVVSVPVGDVAMMLSNVDNCRITRNHDPQEIASKINEVLGLAGTALKLSGRQKIQSLKLDQHSISAKVYDCYKQLVK